MVIPVFIINLPTNITIILIITKINSIEMDSIGITSYYENLPRGKKDSFVREVAEAIGQSTWNARLKMKNGRWSLLEIREITKIIEKR